MNTIFPQGYKKNGMKGGGGGGGAEGKREREVNNLCNVSFILTISMYIHKLGHQSQKKKLNEP